MVETLLHLGPLHPVEGALTFVLAFGPFVLLALTIWISRRRRTDARDGRDVDHGSEGRKT